jgi:hypothetical protein
MARPVLETRNTPVVPTPVASTPLTDPERVDPIPTPNLSAFYDGSFDWESIGSPTMLPKGAPTRVTEAEIPARIVALVEEALRAEEYVVLKIDDQATRSAFVQFVRTYCFVRSAGRLSSRITTMADGVSIKYSVSVYNRKPAATS